MTVAATDGPSPSATLVDRLYTVPDSERVGREKEGEEREAHQRYQRELMKYRRTAKVKVFYMVMLLYVFYNSLTIVQVVYIVDKGHSRTFGGHLKAFDRVLVNSVIFPNLVLNDYT